MLLKIIIGCSDARKNRYLTKYSFHVLESVLPMAEADITTGVMFFTRDVDFKPYWSIALENRLKVVPFFKLYINKRNNKWFR